MRKISKTLVVLGMAVLLAFSFSGCSKKKEGIVIGMLYKCQSDPFHRKLNEAMNGKLDELKASGKIADYYGLDADSDVQKQLNNADDLIARKVDVIIIAPQDANGCAPIVESVMNAGIPLVVVNSKTDNVDQATAFVGSDDVIAGEMMGKYVLEKLGGTGKVVQLEGAIGNSAQIGRNQGLVNTLYAASGIEKLAVLTAKWQRDEAMRITEDWLQKFPQIDAICAENDDMAIGASNAVVNAGRKDSTVIVGVDAITDALDAVKNGDMDATILQDAHGQGEKAVEVAFSIATGGQYEKNTMIPFVLVEKDNVDNYIK